MTYPFTFSVTQIRDHMSRSFSSSASLRALPNHRLYPQVDWDKVESGNYAVVDPVSPGRILYLSEQDYVIMIRVSMTNNRTLKVLAAPGDSPDGSGDNTTSTSQSSTPSSQNTPHPFLQTILADAKVSKRKKGKLLHRLFHSPFLEWRAKSDGSWSSMIEVTQGNLGTVIIRWHNTVSWWSRGKSITTVAAAERNTFSATCLLLFQNNGINFLIEYLKGCLFILNTFLGGKYIKTEEQPSKMRIKTQNGLPVILPLRVRTQLRGRNIHFIHTWTSVLNAYKALQGKWSYSRESILATITQPHPDLYSNIYFKILRAFVDLFWAELGRMGGNLEPDLKTKNLFTSSKAGPHHPNVVLGAPRDAAIWFNPDRTFSGVARNYILDWLDETGDQRLKTLFRRSAKTYQLITDTLSHVARSMVQEPTNSKPSTLSFRDRFDSVAKLVGGFDRLYGKKSFDEGKSYTTFLSRLHILLEPAGKVRVVAIVDWWTHAVLKPLHDWMFSLLKLIPTDATFDQEGALKRFAEQGHTVVWSIDLSSATDLIPLMLYRVLFEPILGARITDLWLRLLARRNFVVPVEIREEKGVIHAPNDLVQYQTGQPMGALSSWSAMAMAHHFLVQAAAWLAEGRFKSPEAALTALRDEYSFWMLIDSFKWYLLYLILGDDLVIADERVARQYIVLAKALGIKVNLKKTFVSEIGFFNFANQSYVGQTNVSPLSLREYVGVDSLSLRSEMAMRAVRRGWTDIKSTKWVAPLMKLFVDQSLWNEVQKDLAQGRTHPVVSWVLSVLLVPGSARFAESVLPRVSIKAFLASMMQKALIWTKPLESIESLIDTQLYWNEIVVILSRAVNSTYQDFLDTRKRLASFPAWSNYVLSVEGEEIYKLVLFDQTHERLKDWEAKYRRPLKTLQVLLRLPDIQAHTLEIGSEMTLTEITCILAKASEDLPHLPDFSQLDFAVLESEMSQGRYEGELNAFSRLLALTNAFEHLHSHATPGFDNHLHRAPPESK